MKKYINSIKIMTKDEIKKGLECCTTSSYVTCDACPYADARICSDTLKNDARKLIIEQEKETERLKAEVKQAQIDVLCKLKQRSCCDNFFADGKWHRYVFVNDIDELIEEVNDEN